MSINVNIILKKIEELGYKILQSGQLKKDRGKSIDPSQIYKENISSFSNITLEEFVNIIKGKSRDIKSENILNPSGLSKLLQDCSFIYRKFRWFVTIDFTKVYYIKMREDAEEYATITTDKDSIKFFNVFNDDEMIRLNAILHEYNIKNPDDHVSAEKVIKMIMEDVRWNPAFRLEKEPVPLSNSQYESCFKFFDLAEIKEAGDKYFEKYGTRPPTPAWDAFFGRIRDQSMVEIIKAFFCGIFYAKNRAKQCLYIWGGGNDGKSQVTAALAEALGPRITFVLDQYMRSNQFSTYDAYGKRLCIGEELSAPNVIKNKPFHALTGNSLTRIEPKNEASFYARLFVCALITSNDKPFIEDVTNQTARLIYVEINKASEDDINAAGLNWAQQLKDETSKMIYDGLRYFEKYNPDGSSYRLPEQYKQETLSQLHDDETIHIDEFISVVFEESEEGKLVNKLGDAFREYVTINYFKDTPLPKTYHDNQIQRKIFEKLKDRYPKIYLRLEQNSGVRQRYIFGLNISKRHRGLESILGPKDL